MPAVDYGALHDAFSSALSEYQLSIQSGNVGKKRLCRNFDCTYVRGIWFDHGGRGRQMVGVAVWLGHGFDTNLGLVGH